MTGIQWGKGEKGRQQGQRGISSQVVLELTGQGKVMDFIFGYSGKPLKDFK